MKTVWNLHAIVFNGNLCHGSHSTDFLQRGFKICVAQMIAQILHQVAWTQISPIKWDQKALLKVH